MIMKFISILFSGLLLAVSASAVSAQNYYICDNGDNNNNGRTETTPFQSYEKAMDTFNKMAAGDSILFCRGGKFEITEKKWIWNNRCETDKPCTVSSYGDESLERPILVSNGETAINFQNPGNSQPDGGYVIRDLILMSTANRYSGIAMYNDVNDLLIENVHIEGFSVGIHAAGANSPEQGSNQANDRITLRNSSIINNASQGWLGGCNDCLIENNFFQNNGFKGSTFFHSIYIDSPVKSQNFKVRNIMVKNNIIKHSTRVNGICQGTSFVVHGIVENLKIHNNQLLEDKGASSSGCWGISIDPGNHLDESFVGLEIVGNVLQNLGGLGIGCASCKNVLITDNTIIDESDVMRNAIAVPNKGEDSLKSENVTIKNNKIINNHELGVGIKLAGQNRFTATGNEISLSSTDTRAKCFKLSDKNLDTDISNNICNSHTSVSIVDETLPTDEFPVAENNEPELPVEQTEQVVELTENDSQPLYQRGSGLVTSNNSIENDSESTLNISSRDREAVTSTTTEEMALSGSAGTSATSSSSETNDSLLDDGINESTFRTGELSSVQDSVSMLENQSSQEASEPLTTELVINDSTVSTSTNQTRSVTVNEIANVIENDIPVDESQCRVFARGRCMMR